MVYRRAWEGGKEGSSMDGPSPWCISWTSCPWRDMEVEWGPFWAKEPWLAVAGGKTIHRTGPTKGPGGIWRSFRDSCLTNLFLCPNAQPHSPFFQFSFLGSLVLDTALSIGWCFPFGPVWEGDLPGTFQDILEVSGSYSYMSRCRAGLGKAWCEVDLIGPGF